MKDKIKKLQKKLQQDNIAKVSKATQVSRPTLLRIRDNKYKNILLTTLQKLFKYYDIK